MRREIVSDQLDWQFRGPTSCWGPKRQSRDFVEFLYFIVILSLAITILKFLSPLNIQSVGSILLSYLAVLQFNTHLPVTLALASGHFQNVDECLEKERESVVAERDAFREFIHQVQSIPSGTRPASGTMATHVGTSSTGRHLQEVRNQYQKIILSVPDYDQTYNETFEEHITAEFGTDVASLVLYGDRFNKQIKNLIIQQASGSAQQRERLLDTIATEEDSVQAARRELKPVASSLETSQIQSFWKNSFNHLVETDEAIQSHLNTCEAVLESRQHDIQTIDRRTSGPTERFFQEYLYDPLDMSFPVLHATLDYIQSLGQRRSALISALSKRVS